MKHTSVVTPPDDDVLKDNAFMSAALALGRRNLGRAAPNPAVGALLVREGVVIARGWTAPGGRPHAEAMAIEAAGDSARGATLYVTLEPCSHHGATPPCVEAIVAAGVSRVVSALEDPNPEVSGQGHAFLRAAGVAVCVGPGAAEARVDHMGHILRVTHGRPLVTLKLAMTPDGYAAGAVYDPRLRITGAVADTFTHVQRWLHDAIMIGAGTAREDDPLMTIRLPGLEGEKRLRVVLDAKLTLSPRSRLAATAREVPLLVIAGEGITDAAAQRFMDATGAEVARAPTIDGRLDILAVLRLLADRGVARVFCEGGPAVAESLIAHGYADEVILHRGVKPLGRPGKQALTPAVRVALADEHRYRLFETRRLGADEMTHYIKAA